MPAESKIVATERLRKEGRWEEASRFRDEARRQLRAAGKNRTEANEAAWQVLLDRYPPPEYARYLDEDEQYNAIQDALFFDDRNLATDAIWAFSNLEATRLRIYDAPSLAAWGLLQRARKDLKCFLMVDMLDALLVGEWIDLPELEQHIDNWRARLADKTTVEMKAEAGRLIHEWQSRTGTILPRNRATLPEEVRRYVQEYI